MVEIHYTEGPEALQDVSKECSDKVTKLISKGLSNSLIAKEEDISNEAIEELRNLYVRGLRRCCFCGAPFSPNGSRRSKCYKEEHYLPCIDCGVPVKVNESYALYMKAGGRRCPKCRGNQIGATRRGKSQEEKDAIVAKQQATMVERYGAPTALQVPEMKAQIQATVREKYGVDNLSQSSAIQEKIRENSRAKYGVDHYSQDPEVRKRMEDGMIAKYGAKTPQQCEELREKTRKTVRERYGVDNVFQNKEVRDTYVANHRAKYGVSWPHQRPELIEQVKKKNRELYGADMYPVSDEYMKTFISNPDKFDDYKAFMTDAEKYIKEHYATKPSVKQIQEDVGTTDSPIYDKLISIGKRDLATEFEYSMETELQEFLLSLDLNIVIEKHNRKILEGKEIDVFLPEFNVGFECNPTYTHNSTFLDPWKEKPKHPKYHADKSILAAEKDVFLYHIFGYEWTHNRSKVLSQIQNLLGYNSRKVYARETNVVEISYPESVNFLNTNHRQGSAQSKIRLGLKLKNSDELVSVMTFGKVRTGIGKDSNTSEDDWELVRFCNLQSTTVVGGASKLFKHFISQYSPSKVISFSDMAHTRGTLYETLGFQFKHLSDPGYVWVNLKTDKYYNRVSCQKANLPNLFDDVTKEIAKSSTENQIMMDHGYAKVFDSGVIRWEWTAEEKE